MCGRTNGKDFRSVLQSETLSHPSNVSRDLEMREFILKKGEEGNSKITRKRWKGIHFPGKPVPMLYRGAYRETKTIFLMVLSISFAGGSSLASVVAGNKPLNKPDFDDIGQRNVTAIVGQTAELNCFVKHPGDRVVSDDSFLRKDIAASKTVHLGQRVDRDICPPSTAESRAAEEASAGQTGGLPRGGHRVTAPSPTANEPIKHTRPSSYRGQPSLFLYRATERNKRKDDGHCPTRVTSVDRCTVRESSLGQSQYSFNLQYNLTTGALNFNMFNWNTGYMATFIKFEKKNTALLTTLLSLMQFIIRIIMIVNQCDDIASELTRQRKAENLREEDAKQDLKAKAFDERMENCERTSGTVAPIGTKLLTGGRIINVPLHFFHDIMQTDKLVTVVPDESRSESFQDIFVPTVTKHSPSFRKIFTNFGKHCRIISAILKYKDTQNLTMDLAKAHWPTIVDYPKPSFRPLLPPLMPNAVYPWMSEQRLKNLKTQKVSWIRKRDLHILTSSIYAYTGDERFSVKHPEASDEWTLKIDYVQQRDAGVYECQVNTEPKLNLAFTLRVEAAQAKILGPEDVYVKKGSTISLTCSVNVQSTPPSSVSWHHGGAVLDFNSPRGGVSLETEKTESSTTSRLLVTQARLTDSGNYTCIPSNANPASVMVHVLNGEHPAAMQHGGSCGVTPTILLATFTLVISNLLRKISCDLSFRVKLRSNNEKLLVEQGDGTVKYLKTLDAVGKKRERGKAIAFRLGVTAKTDQWGADGSDCLPQTLKLAKTAPTTRDKTPTPRTVSRSLVKSVKSTTVKTVGERFPGKLPINRQRNQNAGYNKEHKLQPWFPWGLDGSTANPVWLPVGNKDDIHVLVVEEQFSQRNTIDTGQRREIVVSTRGMREHPTVNLRIFISYAFNVFSGNRLEFFNRNSHSNDETARSTHCQDLDMHVHSENTGAGTPQISAMLSVEEDRGTEMRVRPRRAIHTALISRPANMNEELTWITKDKRSDS
ncbi:hypothetical protein WN51_04311 [Melipona quadrifasciata]|uniref:Ig-like domain-containing protein n=1 Tax=Melipona quadrifasciata TaxID=166423 RepID=A0A0M8ZQW0_9HYME|nr:hypothetical protein WN51_04311 [Melipona quadrifasciata]